MTDIDSSLIRQMHPYAAYDVTDDVWVVQPPQVPEDPRSRFPASWHKAADRDVAAAASISEAHRTSLEKMALSDPQSPDYRVALAVRDRARAKASELYDDIHLGRREAFGPQGHGYDDFANYRWQAAKQAGAIQVLHAIARDAASARREEETRLYGAPIEAAEIVLRRAAQQYRSRQR